MSCFCNLLTGPHSIRECDRQRKKLGSKRRKRADRKGDVESFLKDIGRISRRYGIYIGRDAQDDMTTLRLLDGHDSIGDLIWDFGQQSYKAK